MGAERRIAKVLIVDDDENVRDVLRRMLTKKKFAVEEAENGRIALEKVSQDKPDIIILDVTMPEMDGIETCRRLKENPGTKTLPVIFFSSTLPREEVIQRTKGEADEYIEKPGDLKELCEKINKILKISP
ncbi:MAG: response regulator [Deltaproteobacteria bacterium]|nr:response regulator [Deltaproteobacteria bacterium]